MDENTNNIPQQEGSKGMAIASLVCGIVSITIGCCSTWIGLPTSLVATVLGIIVLSKKKPGKGMAIAGLVMGIIGVILNIVGIIILATVGTSASYLNMINGLN